MTDQHDKQKPNEEDSSTPDTGEEEKTAAASEEEEKVRKLEMSDELRAALEEAESSLQQAEQQSSEQESPADSEKEASSQEGGAGGGTAEESEPQNEEEMDVEVEQEEFDPNKVDEYQEETAPPAPTQAEMELKMQVLELRQKLRDKEAELEQKLKEMKQNVEQARHLQKQFDSYKARTNKEKADWFNYGHEPILKELLSVKDNLERALHHADEAMDIKSLQQGVELTLRQLRSVMEKFGVSGIDAEGEPFNPEYHQAMMQVADDSVPNGTVVEEHQKGYLLKDRLLRPSMVSVSKRPEPDKEQEETERSAGETPAKEEKNAAGAEDKGQAQQGPTSGEDPGSDTEETNAGAAGDKPGGESGSGEG